jgi:UDPglucose 6-dehydrogenase
MRICIVGTGYVGLVTGACFAELGHFVTCVDTDKSKIALLEMGQAPIYEPGIEELVRRNQNIGRISFSTDLAQGMDGCDAAFIAVGTPSREGDNQADVSRVFEVANSIADLITQYTVVVTKSTVPIGTGARLEAYISERVDASLFDVASNPEFLREGSAVKDFMQPERIVIGSESERARQLLSTIYKPLLKDKIPLMMTSRSSAELIKYASNAFLATKVGFINEIADLCEVVGADVLDVARGMGMDSRIGDKFLNPGPGYGGSCFPKDTLALLGSADEHNVDLRIVRSTIEANENRKTAMADRIVAACDGEVDGKRIAILGLTFKANTDDMRESPALIIVPKLISEGAEICAYDPAGMDEAKKLMPDVKYCDSAIETVKSADALVIITDWGEFRSLDLKEIGRLMKTRRLIDLRNCYRDRIAEADQFDYFGIG